MQGAAYMGKAKKINGFTAKEVIDIADRYGVRAYGWMGADLPTLFQKELHIIETRGKAARIFGAGEQKYNPFQYASRFGRKFGTMVEDTARLGVFVDQMKKLKIIKGGKGNTAKIEQAAKHVKKYLFDYTELTTFEREIMKRGLPFYTWLRKNIPLQLESVVKQPQKYARLGDFQNAFWPDTAKPPTEKEIMKSHWMGADRYRRSPWTTKDGRPVYYKIDLPTEELEKMWKPQTWMSALTPVVAMLDILRNVRTWPEAGKLALPGDRVKAPFYMQWASPALQKIAGFSPVWDKKSSEYVMGMNPRWKYALKTAFPFLGEWDRAFPGAGRLVAEDDEGKFFALSYATGIKFRPLDVDRALASTYYKQQRAARQVRKVGRQRETFSVKEAEKIFKQMMEP